MNTMKTIAKMTLLAAGLTAAMPFVNAATPTDAAPGSTPAVNAPAGAHPRARAAMRHRRALARHIAHKLNLNEGQVAQLKSIRSSTRTTVQSIRVNTSLTPELKKTQIREALQAARTQMRSVLTPDQQAKLDEMKNHAWERQGGF